MTTCIFLGPSAPIADALSLFPEARFFPPVQQGDIVLALQSESPTAIGIIDGYFQHRPSVWHKEILWALSNGIHVFGAASMGALRAAELERFGMVGIGRIFDEFSAGALPPFNGLCDDDEVAVIHGPAETGYLAVTDALVNIRFTLDTARNASIVDECSATMLLEHARGLHFSRRTYAGLLQVAQDAGMSLSVLHSLETWLSSGKIDQKRIDALMLVEHLQSLRQDLLQPYQACFRFESTEIWSDAFATMLERNGDAIALNAHCRHVLDELRLDSDAYRVAKHEAGLRMLLDPNVSMRHDSLEGSASHRDQSGEVNEQDLRRLIDDFRQRHELWDRADIDRWLCINDLELSEFEALMRIETQLSNLLKEPVSPALAKSIINYLRTTGTFAPLSKRVQQKTNGDSARDQESADIE